MKSTKRQRQQALFAAILGATAIISLLFFLILYRPARSEYFELQRSIENLRADIQTRQASVERFERLSYQLDTSEQDKLRLITGHFIPYAAGFSQIMPHLDAMAQHAGVKKTTVVYDVAEAPQYGVYSLKIRLPVQGTYANIVNFIKELEDSQTLFIIEAIDIQSASGQSVPAGSEISLDLSLETFLYQ